MKRASAMMTKTMRMVHSMGDSLGSWRLASGIGPYAAVGCAAVLDHPRARRVLNLSGPSGQDDARRSLGQRRASELKGRAGQNCVSSASVARISAPRPTPPA
jgi:hypothetical protein